MKVMFISDIHGSSKYCRKAIEKFEKHKCDMLVILGDILYHGPRNELPDGYDCKEVIKMLNPVAAKIVAVRGNCDSEVDQMVLDFPMRSDYSILNLDGHKFFLTHGHLFDEENMPPLKKGDIFAYGHIHKPVAKCDNDGIYIINPSSVSLPKKGERSFGLYEDDCFRIYTFENELVKEINFD